MSARLTTSNFFVFASSWAMTRTIVSASGAAKNMADRKTTIFDLRSFRECCQTGIAKGLATVTIHDTDGIKAFICDMVKIAGGNKSKPVALICAAGVRSARALKILAANGFTNIQNISEGMLGRTDAGPGWLKPGLHVSSP